jgi:hypothetical protein
MSWVDEFDCRRVVVNQLSVSSPVDQLSGLISCRSTSCRSIGYHRTACYAMPIGMEKNKAEFSTLDVVVFVYAIKLQNNLT